ncbi:MAG: hypothetical protein K2J58_03345, partial [Muribaculaceae bacterium]|nr:hypothetical protein [Muribaculaceae bacterium]
MKAFCSKPRLLWTLGCASAFGLWGTPQAFADDDPVPTITVKTDAYEYANVDNLFTICFDVDEPIYLDVDCGFGLVEYEIEPSQDGTWIPCTVTPEGTVKMYTDKPEVINYLYCQGGMITDIDLSRLTSLQVLDLSNNALKSIDLSNNKEIEYLDLGSNPFDEKPLTIGKLSKLKALEIESVGSLSPDFDMADYPELISFTAFCTKGLTQLDPSGCPKLQRIAIDVTRVSSIDVSKNRDLRILNVADTYITSIDVSHNPLLAQLYVGHQASFAQNYKFSSLDVSNNPELVILFAQNNNIKTIDISHNPKLMDLRLKDNLLESFDCSDNPDLINLGIAGNYLDFATLPLGRVFNEYDYQQRPMPVATSYPVGAQIDLSKKVLREGTETEMELYAVSQNDVRNPILLSKDYYDYEDGVIKFKREYPDSVYASFVNMDFPECVLTTTKFVVKTEEAYGVPVSVLSFSTSEAPGSEIEFGLGVAGASQENPRNVFVDFGNGELIPIAVGCQIPEAANVKGVMAGTGSVSVYVNDGDNVTGLSIDGYLLYNINLEKAPTLRSLSLT